MTETILANAHIITDRDVFLGQVRFDAQGILDLGEGRGVPAGAIDCRGEFVCAGLIELHTDNLDRHVQPRPGVHWPKAAAVLAHDRELASAGITTVFDALRIGSIPSDKRAGYGEYAREVVDRIAELDGKRLLKISHCIHLRAEICTETLVEELDAFGPEDRIGIVSLMNHTPGQRQFRDPSKLHRYLKGKHHLSDAEIEALSGRLVALQERIGVSHRRAAVEHAHAWGAVLASHDDTTEDDVAESATDGVHIAEFPTTLEAARACRRHGQAIMAGAPNVMRGGSHFGNIAAAELADAGLLDILSSDFVPSSLLGAAVRLGERSGDMGAGLATVTSAPADATGLEDRGRLAPGARADVLRFALVDGIAVVRGVWSGGERVG